MTEKRCPKCGKTKQISEFYRSKHTRTGYTSWCGQCHREYAHRPEIKKRATERKCERYASDPEYRARVKAQHEKWDKANPEKVKKTQKRTYLKRKTAGKIKPSWHSEYYQENKEHLDEYTNEYNKSKYAEDQNFKLKSDGLRVINRVIQSYLKLGKIPNSEVLENLVGCSVEYFLNHLASAPSNFEWSQYGRGKEDYSVTFVTPLTDFDLTDPEQYKIAFHYSNIRLGIRQLNAKRPRSNKARVVKYDV